MLQLSSQVSFRRVISLPRGQALAQAERERCHRRRLESPFRFWKHLAATFRRQVLLASPSIIACRQGLSCAIIFDMYQKIFLFTPDSCQTLHWLSQVEARMYEQSRGIITDPVRPFVFPESHFAHFCKFLWIQHQIRQQ
jgi:hypothetical protein